MLLENNKVRAHISSGVFAESVVWQTQRCHKISLFNQLHSYKGRSRVHHALRCDKGNQTAISHLGKTFEKEIIVQRFGSLTVGNLLAHGISRVCHRKISERNIGGSDIKISVEVALNLLEALYASKY